MREKLTPRADSVAARGWNVMRNFGSDQKHRDALEDYIKVAAENGYARSGANMMLER